jgi:ubiquinone/menaquinone biosynthesis C-methylase UbiE
MARSLPESVEIVATDLNPSMLQAAENAGTSRPVTFQCADALKLPFADASFDAVVCQFGAMFFPDKVAGYREARRVLTPSGRFWFNVWDALAHNEVFLVVQRVVVEMFPSDPPLFFERTPYGYHDEARITSELTSAGFQKIEIDRLRIGSHAASAESAARGCCEGTPLRGELEARAPGRLEEITAAAARALEARFGSGSFAHDIQALVVLAS